MYINTKSNTPEMRTPLYSLLWLRSFWRIYGTWTQFTVSIHETTVGRKWDIFQQVKIHRHYPKYSTLHYKEWSGIRRTPVSDWNQESWLGDGTLRSVSFTIPHTSSYSDLSSTPTWCDRSGHRDDVSNRKSGCRYLSTTSESSSVLLFSSNLKTFFREVGVTQLLVSFSLTSFESSKLYL